ncbi:MAG: hypothetical protein M5U09_02820, partial [Gammaproteobacteria bacterium]|nr:hypothetical protein [Gammaproteobacteria bacterium]
MLGLTGLGVPAAALMDVYLVDEQGEPELLPRGDAWRRKGAVEGWTWSWYAAPHDFASSRLLAANLPVGRAGRSTRLRPGSRASGHHHRLHQAGLLELQDEMLPLRAAT